ncbi:MAG: sigma-70 family RNA polymerase sigma factor [Clostridia bacterium]|nr:sigma-70 family RNA polymerase sigma factor [Clostridia bacterium]
MDEERLIERAVRGDARAFNELMSSQERRMYAVALRMFGNKEDAEDCMQDAMLRIYRAIGTFKAQSSFSTWVYRITMNTCLDELRRRKNRPNTSLDGLLDAGWSPSDGRDTPEQHAVRSEARANISRFIGELPEDMRAAVVLRDIQGLSYDDIAAALDTNVGTIKSRISRGREKLREKIQAHAELFDRYGV